MSHLLRIADLTADDLRTILGLSSAGALRVDAIHRDTTFTQAITAAVDAEIDDLATWVRRSM